MSNSTQVQQAIKDAIAELEQSHGSDYPCRSDVSFKSLKSTVASFDGETESLSKSIEGAREAHANYCDAYDDMEQARDEYQETPADSEDEAEADQRYSEAMDHFSNEGGELQSAIQELKFALQDFVRDFPAADAA